jgi:threonine aldolase
MIDLRSDTVTRPSPAMREVIARAEVGDDVLGDDPTVKSLEEEVAAIVGKEAALFVTSGTMGNQLAIATHTRPGDEVIVSEGAHVVWYESGAGAALSGVQFVAAGRDGLFTADEMEAAMKPAVYWGPRTSLVCIENTHNRAGGRVFPADEARAVAERARARGLATHVDGARIWNASAASGIPVHALCAPFDTASVCFSKGLGAPVGSALCGPRPLIERARRLRKMWGGGMRQSGLLAAAARYALTHHRERIADDHANARRFAEKLSGAPGITVDVAAVETNIVIVEVDPRLTGEGVAAAAREQGVALSTWGPHKLRAVTHMDVSRADVEVAAERLITAVARALERAPARGV